MQQHNQSVPLVARMSTNISHIGEAKAEIGLHMSALVYGTSGDRSYYYAFPDPLREKQGDLSNSPHVSMVCTLINHAKCW